MAANAAPSGYLERPKPSGLADVIEIILDKGIVIDAYVRVSLIGIELITIDARIVIASVDTYLRFAEAVGRLNIADEDGSQGLPELMESVTQGGAKSKTKGALEGVKEKLPGGGETTTTTRAPAASGRRARARARAAAVTMSEVHVHGVTHAAERAAIEGAGARAVVHGELAAVVGDAAPDTRAADLARRHWQVLEAIAATATVLPVRFGTVMAGDAAVAEELLAPDHDALRARLARFEGTVQLTVKGTYDEAALMRSIVEGSPEVARLRERVRALPEAAGHFERIKLGEMVAGAVEQAREQDAARLLEHLDAACRRPAGSSRRPAPTAPSTRRSSSSATGPPRSAGRWTPPRRSWPGASSCA